MDIIVCMKQVPDSEAQIRVRPDGKGIIDSDIKFVMNPYDEFAVEEALKLKEKFGGSVTLICLGPQRAVDAIRTGLAMGADKAVHLDDPAFEGGDAISIAKALAAVEGRLHNPQAEVCYDVLAGRDIVMLSDGGPKRTFCYVADAVTGYYKILVRGHAGEPYNIGVESPEISVAELADRVAALARELFGYRGRVVHRASADGDYLVDNPARRCPVIAKARAHLGYDPRIPIDEALRRSLLWYRDNQQAEEA